MDELEIDGTTYQLDENGNALDKEGNIFMSKVDIEARNNGGGEGGDEPVKVEVEGKTYILDADGNAVNEKGEIVYTKDDLVEADGKDEPEGILEKVKTLSGIEVFDEKGEPVIYEETLEGYANREKDVYVLGIESGKQKGVTELFTTFPEVKSLYEYISKYGTSEGFGSKTDYINLTMDEKDNVQLKSLLIAEKMAKGETRVEAEYQANLIEADGKLVEKGKVALEFLKNKQQLEEKALLDSRAKIEKDNTEALEKKYGVKLDKAGNVIPLNVEGSIYDKVVVKGKIGDLELPKAGLRFNNNGKVTTMSREDLFNYIAISADEYGRSQAEIDLYNKLSNPDYQLTQYIEILLGGDLTQLIQAAAQKQKVETVKRYTLKNTQQQQQQQNNRLKKLVMPIGD